MHFKQLNDPARAHAVIQYVHKSILTRITQIRRIAEPRPSREHSVHCLAFFVCDCRETETKQDERRYVSQDATVLGQLVIA